MSSAIVDLSKGIIFNEVVFVRFLQTKQATNCVVALHLRLVSDLAVLLAFGV